MAAVKVKIQLKKTAFCCRQNWPFPLPPVLRSALAAIVDASLPSLLVFILSAAGRGTRLFMLINMQNRTLRPPTPPPRHIAAPLLLSSSTGKHSEDTNVTASRGRTWAPIDDSVRNRYSAKEQDR